jgi:hypothetical protein
VHIVERIQEASSKQPLLKRIHQSLVQSVVSRIVQDLRVKRKCTTLTAKRPQTNESVRQESVGGAEVKPEDVLQKLANHEEKCDLRYQRIEERLDDQKKTLEKLDLRLWGLAALIVALAAAERFI